MTFLMTYAFLRTLTRGNHCACLVEAVGIEPYCQRYANPTRTLGFPAYRFERHPVRPLTLVPCSTLESPCLPCALVTIWSLTSSRIGSTYQHPELL